MISIAALSLFAPMVIATPKAAHACRTLHLVANHEGTQSAYSLAKLLTLGKHTRLVDRNQPWRDLHQQRCFQIDR